MRALERCWQPLAWSHQVANKPVEVTVLGKSLVIFRDAEGRACVVDDRCLHKGVKLSKGRCLSGKIQCPYHGWEYNSDGSVARIPSHIASDILPTARIKCYAVIEQENTIWCCLSASPYEKAPPPWHYFEEKRFFTTTFNMDCNYIHLLENLVENTHARYIHDGLLRNSQQTTKVEAVVKKTGCGVHAQTFGETAKGSLLYRLFGDAKRELDHTEEFIAPNIIRIIFSQPGKIHIASQLICVPIDHTHTRIFFRVALQCRLSWLLLPILKYMLVQGILTQDASILEHETQQNLKWPNPTAAVSEAAPGKLAPGTAVPAALTSKSDTAAIWVRRIANAYADKGPAVLHKQPLKTTRVTYQL